MTSGNTKEAIRRLGGGPFGIGEDRIRELAREALSDGMARAAHLFVSTNVPGYQGGSVLYDIHFRVTVQADSEQEARDAAERLEDNLRDPMLSVQSVHIWGPELTAPGESTPIP